MPGQRCSRSDQEGKEHVPCVLALRAQEPAGGGFYICRYGAGRRIFPEEWQRSEGLCCPLCELAGASTAIRASSAYFAPFNPRSPRSSPGGKQRFSDGSSRGIIGQGQTALISRREYLDWMSGGSFVLKVRWGAQAAHRGGGYPVPGGLQGRIGGALSSPICRLASVRQPCLWPGGLELSDSWGLFQPKRIYRSTIHRQAAPGAAGRWPPAARDGRP